MTEQSANMEISERANNRLFVPQPICHRPRDKMDYYVVRYGEELVAMAMHIRLGACSKMPRPKHLGEDEAEILREAVIKSIRKNGPLTQDQLVKKLNTSRNRMTHAIRILRQQGKIKNSCPDRKRYVSWQVPA